MSICLADNQSFAANAYSFKNESMTEGSIATKVAQWDEIRKGDCHQIEGTLVLQSDGVAHFKCVTWTDSTHSGDYWHAGFEFQDQLGVALFHSLMYHIPRMDDGHPSPRYSWGADFNFDPNIFNAATYVLQACDC